MTYIIAGLILIYVITISVGLYFYKLHIKNKALITENEQAYNDKISDLETKMNNDIKSQKTDIINSIPDMSGKFSELSTLISSGFTELGSPILNKFTEIERDISQLNELFENKVKEVVESLTQDKDELSDLKNQVITLQSKIESFSTYFSLANEMQTHIENLEKSVNEISTQINQKFKDDFIDIQLQFNSIKNDITSFRFDSLNVKNMDASIFDMNNAITKIQQDILQLKEKLKREEENTHNELQDTINPTDIIVDDNNVKQQVQQIIEYSITPKIKSNNKRIEELLDNGEIMIKGANT